MSDPTLPLSSSGDPSNRKRCVRLVVAIVLAISAGVLTFLTADAIHSSPALVALCLADTVLLGAAVLALYRASGKRGRTRRMLCLPFVIFFAAFFSAHCPAGPLMSLTNPPAYGGYVFPSTAGSTNPWIFAEGSDPESSSILSYDPGTNCDWEGNRYLFCLSQSFTNVTDPSGRTWCLMSSTNLAGTNWVPESFSMTVWISTNNAIFVVYNSQGAALCTNYGALVGSSLTNVHSAVTNTMPGLWIFQNKGSQTYYRLMTVVTNAQGQIQPSAVQPEVVFCPVILVWVARIIVLGVVFYCLYRLYRCANNLLNNTNKPPATNDAAQ